MKTDRNHKQGSVRRVTVPIGVGVNADEHPGDQIIQPAKDLIKAHTLSTTMSTSPPESNTLKRCQIR
jgi:hypothetical protein